MIAWYFNRFVNKANEWGMPVRFLQLVASRYTFGETWFTTNANPWLNTIDFDSGDVAMLQSDFRPGGTIGEASLVQTLYHESTHAYLDLKENERKFQEFIRHGEAYYRGAPLAGGGAASDPERIFQEAAASYVGHRAAIWYGTYDQIESLREMVDQKTWEGRGDSGFYDRVERLVRGIPSEYDQSMRDRVFGYQERSGQQVETTKAISTRIKAFCDEEILENKISDTFARSVFLKRRHDSLLALITQSRTIVPIEVW